MTITIKFTSGKIIELTEQEFKELYGTSISFPTLPYYPNPNPYPNPYPNYPIITCGGSTCR